MPKNIDFLVLIRYVKKCRSKLGSFRTTSQMELVFIVSTFSCFPHFPNNIGF